ncbi:BTB/POZ domain-containing protein KCTD21-like [Mercenaria mercenaria]|uniref:BTB/POZ domain-containing protein KCTD21-like n=1 Tax=Mercenaria mercenaria TaxID=6596 RepID=UPI00234F4D12|nr:BTB/POZ domain-containing protein KCTD21-like [Mercenaria mercenaria]
MAMDTTMDTAMFRDDVVELNVGGKLMTTWLSTLTKEPKCDTPTKEPKSKLAAMFSRPEDIAKDKDGRFFIDCDGELFQYILNFLRYGTLPRQERILEVYDLALHFQIQSLVAQLERFYAIQYRNKIAEIREYWGKKGNTQIIEKLKQNIVENIHCRPREDITIYETSNVGSCDLCPIRPAHVFLQPSNLSAEMRALLIHDLCELGFAKSTVTKKINRKCDICNIEFKGFEIVLVAK